MRNKIIYSTIAAMLLSSSALVAQNTNTAPVYINGEVANSGGLYSLSFPNNGIVWSTEDPNVSTPLLQVAALSFASYDGKKILAPIEFYIRANYSAFIDRMEVMVYSDTDRDLVEPLATIPVKPSAFAKVSWDGALSDKHKFETGDRLIYVVKAYSNSGQFDETGRYEIQLQKPEDASKALNDLRDTVSQGQGKLLSESGTISQHLLNKAFAGNGLSHQNIPVVGSKVTIRGTNVPNGSLFINGEQYPIDLQKNFVADYMLPTGTHVYNIAFRDGATVLSDNLKIDVSGNYFFGIAMADFTLSKAKISGVGANEYFDKKDTDLLKDGRLAFYVKSKLRNRFLVTAQADTTERDIKDMFKGFTKANPKDVFQSLDPNMYYPTYGDDSTMYRDVDTQGKFYLRVDWDKSKALWGNFNTGFTGTQYAQYSRSLYGAALDYRTIDNNPWGDPRSSLKVFGAEAKSARGHSELLGTGGSLYYLRHTNILGGSEKVVLEVKDSVTQRILANVNLVRGIDYEINEFQGRIILNKPLSQITKQNMTSITTEGPLEGYEQTLIVDYEWTPNGFNDDMISAGVRGKHWLNDNIGIGATYVKEEAEGKDYEIAGGDLVFQTKGTYIKGEYTHTRASSGKMFYSDNGGLSFEELGQDNREITGDAKAVDVKVNFKELGATENEFHVAGWWRHTNKGYGESRSSSSAGVELTEFGAELMSEITENWKLYLKASRTLRNKDAHIQASVTTEIKIAEKVKISAEVKHTDTRGDDSKHAHGTLGALRVDYDITPNLNVYGTGQLTLDNNNGEYKNNDAVILGTRYMFADTSSVSAEYTTGHRGDSLKVDASYQINPDHTVYGGYTWANSPSSDFNSAFNSNKKSGWTLGQRWNLSNQVTLYNESQLLSNKESMNNIGMDFHLGEGWNLGLMYQKGKLGSTNTSKGTTRDAVSFSVGRTSAAANWMSKLEFRKDSGAQSREQWVSTNRITYKVNESLRLAGRFNYSDTTDKIDTKKSARFVEGNLGFAYRPFDSTRWGFFGRYTYLYDLSSLGQLNGINYDQKTQVLSLEGVYKHDGNWEFALKVAGRKGEARYGRGTGAWFDSRTLFFAAQVRYDILAKWHAMVEYRALEVRDGGLKHGFMIGIDRDITDNFRIGAGYNFTDFSDDLTKLDYKYRGWFINVLGTY